jgi:hypothetical protein
MNFNHDTGLIDSLLTIDTTVAPPLGGTTQSLQITGTGAIYLPLGTTAQRPANSAGMLRYNTESSVLEYNTGTVWSSLATGGGTVTSVAVSGGTGLSVSGSPITSSGTITLSLDAGLQTLASLATVGMISQSAADTFVARTITGTASNITVSNGDGASGNPTIDLATVTQGSTGTSFVKVQLDSKGRVINNTAVVASDITTLVDATYVNVSGDSMSSGANLTFSGGGEVLGLPATPTTSGSAVSKAYVDSLLQGLDPKQSVRVTTTTSGTLASSFVNGATVDGVTLVTGDRILIKNQATASENGIYIVTAGTPTRATDFDAWSEIPGAFVFVEEGTTNKDTGWVSTSDQGGTLGSTNITFVQFGGAGTYTAGTGLTLSGTTFSITAPIAVSLGGTGLTSAPANGQLLIGNATGYTLATLTAGTGIGVANAAGSITISNSGVTALAGTANQITASASTGSVTLSLPSAITAPGSLTVTTNLTVSGLTANSMVYSGTAGLLTATAAPTNGQILIGSTGAAPTLATLTAGTGIGVANAAGSITISNSGVTSFTQTVPSIMSITGASAATGAVSAAITLANQTTNTVFAAPNGSTGTPTFRALVAADIGGALQLWRENVSSPTTPIATGTNSVAIGSSSSAGAQHAIAFGPGTSATLYGQRAYANGTFATAGDAQASTYVMRNITSTATVTELFLDGSATRLVMPNNSVWTFSILISGRRTDATGGGAGYRVDGVIRKDTTAASAALVGAVTKSILGETNAAWDVTVSADTTNGALRVQVTGEAAKTIRWVAVVQTAEVTN